MESLSATLKGNDKYFLKNWQPDNLPPEISDRGVD